ncbi:MAG: DUF4281 domain-containing protein [Planctomycetes bacterium]|nr:DUF4281 domain-containing protein [Planctomycetota bacterium]
MTPEAFFTLSNGVSLVGWLLLIVAPRWKWSARLICPVVAPFLLGLVYIGLLLSLLGQLDGGFGTLEEVARLFENRYALLAGWVHYLAFDLFVGSWQVRDAQRLGISHGFVVPCLILTLLFGPAGLVLYFVVRWAAARNASVEDSPARSASA